MINNSYSKLYNMFEESGVSPVIGVILMVAITVSLVVLVSVVVFNIGGDVSESPDATVELVNNDGTVEATVLRNENVKEFKIRYEDGTTQSIGSEAGDRGTIEEGSGTYQIIAVMDDGSEQVLQTKEYESVNTGTTDTFGNNVDDYTLTSDGKIEFNPPAEGVKIEAVDSDGNVFDSDVTDKQGSYSLEYNPSDHNIKINGYDYDASIGSDSFWGDAKKGDELDLGDKAYDIGDIKYTIGSNTKNVNYTLQSNTGTLRIDDELYKSEGYSYGKAQYHSNYKRVGGTTYYDEFDGSSLESGDTISLPDEAEGVESVRDGDYNDVSFTYDESSNTVTIDGSPSNGINDLYYYTKLIDSGAEYTIPFDNFGIKSVEDGDYNSISYTKTSEGVKITEDPAKNEVSIDYYSKPDDISSGTTLQLPNIDNEINGVTGIQDDDWNDVDYTYNEDDNTVTINEDPANNVVTVNYNITGERSITFDYYTPSGNSDINLYEGDVDSADSVPEILMDGSGTSSDPYEIDSASDLQSMKEDKDASYELVDNIDASNTEDWNNKKGFDPVGYHSDYSSESFKGDLYGQYYEINNLHIDRDDNRLGIIGYTDSGNSEFKNIKINNIDIDGKDKIGSLIGYGFDVKSVQNIESNNIDIDGNNNVGGILGRVSLDNTNSDKGIDNLSTSGSIKGKARVGGIGGNIRSGSNIINNTSSKSNIEAKRSFGGLFGDISPRYTNLKINNSHSTGSVTKIGGGCGDWIGCDQVGGLIGKITKTSSDSYINNSYYDGVISGVGAGEIGGLVGSSELYINNSYTRGSIDGGGNRIGGLVGSNSHDGYIIDSNSSVSIDSVNDNLGGLVGTNDGNINKSYATGDINGDVWDSGSIGGLVGSNHGNINKSYATGDVKSFAKAGGLIGINYGGNINKSYATGDVESEYDTGGLVGLHEKNGNINNSYAIGDVNGDNSFGGLVGDDLAKTWWDNEPPFDSYWDTQSTGQSSSYGGSGLTTSEMQGSNAKDNMDLNFSSTWDTVSGDYPELSWQE